MHVYMRQYSFELVLGKSYAQMFFVCMLAAFEHLVALDLMKFLIKTAESEEPRLVIRLEMLFSLRKTS